MPTTIGAGPTLVRPYSMSFKSRLVQGCKDYATAVKVSTKTAYHIGKGSTVAELEEIAKPFEAVYKDSQRLKDAQKVGAAVSVAIWTTIIACVIED